MGFARRVDHMRRNCELFQCSQASPTSGAGKHPRRRFLARGLARVQACGTHLTKRSCNFLSSNRNFSLYLLELNLVSEMSRGALRHPRPYLLHRPRTRGGWSADRALFCFVARARRDLRALRRGLSRSERDLSRRSTMAIFGRGPMPPPPGVKDRSRQRLVRKPQGLAERSLASRGSGSRRNRGTPLPAPPSGSSPETPLMSEDANL
jgi:hypothetical protein